VASRDAARRRTGGAGLPAFLDYLDAIEHALLTRNAQRHTSLLRKRIASHLPRDVREELLMLSRAPREGYRAPVQLLRFRHRMQQLAAGGERMLTAQTELRLEPKPHAGEARRRTAAERPAACDPAEPDHDEEAEEWRCR